MDLAIIREPGEPRWPNILVRCSAKLVYTGHDQEDRLSEFEELRLEVSGCTKLQTTASPAGHEPTQDFAGSECVEGRNTYRTSAVRSAKGFVLDKLLEPLPLQHSLGSAKIMTLMCKSLCTAPQANKSQRPCCPWCSHPCPQWLQFWARPGAK